MKGPIFLNVDIEDRWNKLSDSEKRQLLETMAAIDGLNDQSQIEKLWINNLNNIEKSRDMIEMEDNFEKLRDPNLSLWGHQQPKIVEVKEGDTLSHIALREMGSADKAELLWAINVEHIEKTKKEKFPDKDYSGPNWIFPGMMLKIPPEYTSKGDTLKFDAKIAAHDLGENVTDLPTEDFINKLATHKPGNKWKIIEVKNGETLKSIALRELGSEDEWEKLWEINFEAIARGNNPEEWVFAGTKLIIPNETEELYVRLADPVDDTPRSVAYTSAEGMRKLHEISESDSEPTAALIRLMNSSNKVKDDSARIEAVAKAHHYIEYEGGNLLAWDELTKHKKEDCRYYAKQFLAMLDAALLFHDFGDNIFRPKNPRKNSR